MKCVHASTTQYRSCKHDYWRKYQQVERKLKNSAHLDNVFYGRAWEKIISCKRIFCVNIIKSHLVLWRSCKCCSCMIKLILHDKVRYLMVPVVVFFPDMFGLVVERYIFLPVYYSWKDGFIW